MSTIPVVSYPYQVQNVQTVYPQQPVNIEDRESFPGEAKLLMQVYQSYMNNVGGYQNINGQMVHVTTKFHLDENAQRTAMAIEDRLIKLGALPQLPQQPQMSLAQPKQMWTDPTRQISYNA